MGQAVTQPHSGQGCSPCQDKTWAWRWTFLFPLLLKLRLPHGTIVMDTRHFTFVKTHGMYNAKSEPKVSHGFGL